MGPVSLPKLKKAYEKAVSFLLLPYPTTKEQHKIDIPAAYDRSNTIYAGTAQGRTDNSWGPRAIGDHGALVSLPKFKKAYEKGTRGISWGPLLTPGPRAVPEFPNGQSTP
ncbi:unnamed protein product, partial [Staurois parvus]